jgi:SagB-type dehydrogenase family enzyme
MKKIITLPAPQKDLDFPLMKAIEQRRTKRKWQDADVSMQDVANILWVACGITYEATERAKSRRTAPSSCNSQEISVYVAMSCGLYLYDETAHQLVKVMDKDIRMHIGTQKMMQSAPLGLIYVSDYRKLNNPVYTDDARRWYTSAADAAFMSENIYLYCTAANLSTAVLGLVDREKLHEIMGLSEHEKVVYSQVVGNSIDLV